MSAVALYTFGLLDPEMGPDRMTDFGRRGTAIYGDSEQAPGFLGRAENVVPGREAPASDEAAGPWGRYLLPLGLPDFAGDDPAVHIATLSLWRDVPSARGFVYGGRHRDALRVRHDWFLRGPWPGHVLWRVDDGVTPRWADGVQRLEAVATEGETADRFTFGSRWAAST